MEVSWESDKHALDDDESEWSDDDGELADDKLGEPFLPLSVLPVSEFPSSFFHSQHLQYFV